MRLFFKGEGLNALSHNWEHTQTRRDKSSNLVRLPTIKNTQNPSSWSFPSSNLKVFCNVSQHHNPSFSDPELGGKGFVKVTQKISSLKAEDWAKVPPPPTLLLQVKLSLEYLSICPNQLPTSMYLPRPLSLTMSSTHKFKGQEKCQILAQSLPSDIPKIHLVFFIQISLSSTMLLQLTFSWVASLIL